MNNQFKTSLCKPCIVSVKSPRQGLYSLGQPETAWRYPQGLNWTEEQRRQRKEQEREEGDIPSVCGCIQGRWQCFSEDRTTRRKEGVWVEAMGDLCVSRKECWVLPFDQWEPQKGNRVRLVDSNSGITWEVDLSLENKGKVREKVIGRPLHPWCCKKALDTLWVTVILSFLPFAMSMLKQ